jgi:hypothetical protein
VTATRTGVFMGISGFRAWGRCYMVGGSRLKGAPTWFVDRA